jgi:predicted small secreted protein
MRSERTATGALRRAAIAVALLGVLAGCNTVEGVGLDIAGGARTVGGWLGGG